MPTTQRLTRLLARPLALACAAELGLACGADLPVQDRIASTRPLAMRVEVIDPFAAPDAPVRAEALPFESVRILPFIANELGPLTLAQIDSELEPVWLACAMQPIGGLFSCISEAAEGNETLLPSDLVACPEPDLGALDPQAEGTAFPSPCLVSGGRPAVPELTIPLELSFLIGGDLELTMVAHKPGQGSTQLCLEQLLDDPRRLEEDCLLVTQRVAVGPNGRLLQLAQDFGIPGIEQFGSIPDPIPDPDTHPRILSFTLRIFEDDVQVQSLNVERGQVVEAKLGQRIEVEVLAPPEDLQTYVIPADVSDFEQRQEHYVGAWYRNWGDLLGSSSNDPRAINTWIMASGNQDEQDVPPEGRATLYYVLRDERGGVNWWWVHLDVAE